MEAQGKHDPQKSIFLESEVKGRISSGNIRVEWRIISAAEFLTEDHDVSAMDFGQVNSQAG